MPRSNSNLLQNKFYGLIGNIIEPMNLIQAEYKKFCFKMKYIFLLLPLDCVQIVRGGIT